MKLQLDIREPGGRDVINESITVMQVLPDIQKAQVYLCPGWEARYTQGFVWPEVEEILSTIYLHIHSWNKFFSEPNASNSS